RERDQSETEETSPGLVALHHAHGVPPRPGESTRSGPRRRVSRRGRSEPILHADVRPVTLRAVLEKPGVDVAGGEARGRRPLAGLPAPVLEADLHRQTAPDLVREPPIGLKAQPARRFAMEARIVPEITPTVVDVVDDAVRPRHEERPPLEAESAEQRHLRAPTQSKAVPVVVLGDDLGVRRDRGNDARKTGRGAEGNVAL